MTPSERLEANLLRVADDALRSIARPITAAEPDGGEAVASSDDRTGSAIADLCGHVALALRQAAGLRPRLASYRAPPTEPGRPERPPALDITR